MNSLNRSIMLGAAAAAGGAMLFVFGRQDVPRVNTGVRVVAGPGAQASGAPGPVPARSAASAPVRNADEAATATRVSALRKASDDVAPVIAYVPSLKAMHDKLRAEGRDNAWASQAEASIRDGLDRLPGADGMPPMAVNCGTTLCELHGSLPDGGGVAADTWRRSMTGPEFVAKMWGNGYRNMGEGYGPGPDGTQRFVVYYQRETPTTVKAGRPPAPAPAGASGG